MARLLCLLACLFSLRAQAQAPAHEARAASEYEVALSEALSAHARSDYAQARIFMERAHQLEPSARTLRGLGIVAFAQGRHLEAIRYLEQALHAQEKPLPPELRSAVEELVSHAWGQVGRYELLISPPSGDFLIDGEAPDLYAPHTVVLLPGNHVLTARAPARAPYEMTLEVKPGEQRRLHVVLAIPPAPLAVHAPTSQLAQQLAAAPATEQRGFWTPTKRWIALGSGAALVASGAALWGLAYARLNRLADDCRDHADGVCTEAEATGAYRAEHIRGLGIGAGVLLGTGAVTLLGVVVIELRQARQRGSQARTVAVRPGLGALALRLRF